MKKLFGSFGIILLVLLGMLFSQIAFIVEERDQSIITEFGKPIGNPITKAGLYFKKPFIQKVIKIDKRVLEWDGHVTQMPTRDKLYIFVDTFARWRIVDPLRYFTSLTDERSARSRMNDILGSETRNAVAKHDLIEMIRTTKGRVPIQIEGEEKDLDFESIQRGRALVEKDIFDNSRPKLETFGIELLDIRFKRINYNEQVEREIFARMTSERKQIAERFRSDGAGEAERIIGSREKEVREIRSEAYRKVQEILGEADAKSTKIYADAYGSNQEVVDFYRFVKTLETYDKVIDANTSTILSTDSELYKLLKTSVK